MVRASLNQDGSAWGGRCRGVEQPREFNQHLSQRHTMRGQRDDLGSKLTRLVHRRVSRVAFRLNCDNQSRLSRGDRTKTGTREVVSGRARGVLQIAVLVDAESHCPLTCQHVRLLCGDAHLKIGRLAGFAWF